MRRPLPTSLGFTKPVRLHLFSFLPLLLTFFPSKGAAPTYKGTALFTITSSPTAKSVEACLDFCASNGAKKNLLCAVDSQGKCYTTTSEYVTAETYDDEQCATVCGGKPTEICGGSNGKLTVYRRDAIPVVVTTTTSASTTTTTTCVSVFLPPLPPGDDSLLFPSPPRPPPLPCPFSTTQAPTTTTTTTTVAPTTTT
jgi:hypothetical protein